jgi:hypothetical protein
MPNNPGIVANNHEKDQLVVDLEHVILESKDLISSNQNEKVGLIYLMIAYITNHEKTRQQTISGLFQFTCGNIISISESEYLLRCTI